MGGEDDFTSNGADAFDKIANQEQESLESDDSPLAIPTDDGMMSLCHKFVIFIFKNESGFWLRCRTL